MTTLISKSAAYIAARTTLGDHRKVFDSLSDAIESLAKIFATEGFPAEFPVVAARIGVVDPTIPLPAFDKWPDEYKNAGTRICVSFIGIRGLKDDKDQAVNGARGFAIYPLHAIDAIRADESGEEWLWKIAEKEGSHVALRGLRNVTPALGTEALAAAAMSMPLSVADYVEESTRDSMDTSAFDAIWKRFRKILGERPQTAALVPSLPTKGEVLKAIRSKAYALQEYKDLEDINSFTFIATSMAGVIDHMRAEAIKAGAEFEMDSSEIRGWLATRDTKVFPTRAVVESDLSTVDFDAFQAFLLPTAATDAATVQAEGANQPGNE